MQIKWLKDNKEISAVVQRMTTNKQDNSLTISGTIVRDSGSYTCVATNGLDQEEASAMLTVRGEILASAIFSKKQMVYGAGTFELAHHGIEGITILLIFFFSIV